MTKQHISFLYQIWMPLFLVTLKYSQNVYNANPNYHCGSRSRPKNLCTLYTKGHLVSLMLLIWRVFLWGLNPKDHLVFLCKRCFCLFALRPMFVALMLLWSISTGYLGCSLKLGTIFSYVIMNIKVKLLVITL